MELETELTKKKRGRAGKESVDKGKNEIKDFRSSKVDESKVQFKEKNDKKTNKNQSAKK